MSRPQKKNSNSDVTSVSPIGTNAISISSSSDVGTANTPFEPAIQRAMPHVAAGHYEKALGILATGGSTPPVQNARGVCLLRLGRYEDAVRLYRGLVLQAGGTWSKADVPTLHKTNFAMALLLEGHPSGCLSMLEEIGDESYPPVIRLRKALAQWVKSLTFLQRMNWWFGRIEPPHCHVAVDFPPGDLVETQAAANDDKSIPMNVYPPAVEQR